MVELPTSISDSIIEATLEVRFESTLPKGALFGIVYKEVGDLFDKVEKLLLVLYHQIF